MSTRTCPNGHVMEVSWTSCPYCARSSRRIPDTVAGMPVPVAAPPPAHQATQMLQVPMLLGWVVALDGARKGEAYEIRGGRVVLGSNAKTASFALPDAGISGEHARIDYYHEERSWVLLDLDSLNGTFLNQDRKRLLPRNPIDIADNDVITLAGKVRLVFKCLPQFALDEAGPPAP